MSDPSSAIPTAADDPCAYTGPADYSYGYHVGGLFVILVASLLGTGIPLIAHHFPKTAQFPFVWICGKHVGTGVLIALSLIHLLAPAFEELGNECNPPAFTVGYSYAPLFAMIAALLMHLIESVAQDYTRSVIQKQQDGTAHSHDHNHSHNDHAHGHRLGDIESQQKGNDNGTVVNNIAGLTPQSQSPAEHHHHNQFNHRSPPSTDMEIAVEKDVALKDIELTTLATTASCDQFVHPHDTHGHSHGLLLDPTIKASRSVSAYILEFGLTAHSVIIGITVGVADNTTMNTLLAALTFHQFFEGFALGARLSTVGFTWKTETLLASVYSLSAPIGIGIGIGIFNSYNGTGVTANLVQGSFDAVSAGILLYVGFVQLLGGDFAHDYAAAGSWWRKALLFLCLYVGATVMAVIGIWL